MDDRQMLFKKIQVLCFALLETNLFLDTHPTDQKALAFFKMYQKQKDEAVMEYTKKYGPLTAQSGMYDTKWTWVDGPWPWENQYEVMRNVDL